MLGARISALRKDRGMSQSDLARRLRVSASTVGMYEQGRREPSADRLVELARIFSVTTDYLLTGIPVSRQDESALFRTFRQSLYIAQAQNDLRLDSTGRPPFTHQELEAIVAALLAE